MAAVLNPYLDHLLDLVEPDGSFSRESRGVKESGFADVERAAILALVVEIRALRETLGSLANFRVEEPPAK